MFVQVGYWRSVAVVRGLLVVLFSFFFLSLFGFAVSVSDLVWIASAFVDGCWWLLLC
jgi:hypothetical protein